MKGNTVAIIIIICLAALLGYAIYSFVIWESETHTISNALHETKVPTAVIYYEDGVKDGINGTFNTSIEQAHPYWGYYKDGYMKGIELRYCKCGGV